MCACHGGAKGWTQILTPPIALFLSWCLGVLSYVKPRWHPKPPGLHRTAREKRSGPVVHDHVVSSVADFMGNLFSRGSERCDSSSATDHLPERAILTLGKREHSDTTCRIVKRRSSQLNRQRGAGGITPFRAAGRNCLFLRKEAPGRRHCVGQKDLLVM